MVKAFIPELLFENFETNVTLEEFVIIFKGLPCADPEGGGTGGPDPPLNLNILPKKR